MKTINVEQRKQAYKYYCMGLNSKEIGKLVDVSFRTVQNWMQSENWKGETIGPKVPPLMVKALELRNNGLSLNEIAKALSICRTTAFKYVKQAKENE
ncbi:MAG: hypothetical protein GYB55_10245 [Cytophagales bacterium]|nr:hypothetical protein [Cytophagales bacterium]|tara:strand:- start:40292 stop:40582 length:291 start_codon:yes stop_codon:yes gene_type:complete